MPDNIPQAFLNRIGQQFPGSSDAFVKALQNNPVLSVRMNSLKACPVQYVDYELVPWCANGRYLSEKPVYTLDPLFHAGCYYPQEASSMFIDWLLRNVCNVGENPRVLDLCGAPGGKSTLLASWLNGKGLLVANEIIKNRAGILLENIVKWGAPNTIVTNNKPSDFAKLHSFFDIMLVDAPCSGEGMFRKDQRAVDEWTEDNARMCAARQQQILSDVWPALKEGGYMIYSTCTFNPAENEENLKWFASEYGAQVLSLNVPEAWGIESVPVADGNGLAFYPHRVKGEGFFVAVLLKTNSSGATLPNIKTERKKINTGVPNEISRFFLPSQPMGFIEDKTGWRALPELLMTDLKIIQQRLHTIHFGVQTGQIVKNNLIPSHELAMSTALDITSFPIIDLPKTEALRFLKGEAIQPPVQSERGYNLITYENAPLGFVKNIGNRLNNLYPLGWRIRMSLPQ